MLTSRLSRIAISLFVVGGFLTTFTFAQSDDADLADDTGARIAQALSAPVTLDVASVPIGRVMDQLAKTANVPIEIAPAVFELLPYGSKTQLSARATNRSLRTVLTALLNPLALTFEASDQHIVIEPTKPLWRIAGRATWEELTLLQRLTSEPFNQELFNSLKFRFEDAGQVDADIHRQRLWHRAKSVGAATAAAALEYACEQSGQAWAPDGDVVTVRSQVRQIERQLQRRVTVRYDQTSLTAALLDLANKAGVLLQMEPGVLASLPTQMDQRFSLAIENATIQQTLELVTGQVGLDYRIESAGLRLVVAKPTTSRTLADDASAAAALRALRSDRIVGQVTIPNPDGSSYSFFIRESDLPPEVNALRQAKIRRSVNDLRRALFAEQPQD